ncbi:PSD1 and planctomycete cytochrome C domain-containing protein [Flavihumibacter rivuli]|uniref:PSD1 and planctomycete cytochrome C domain-containing protein n=1 Tax=Flavihumibacter rivuli TaxID=2838156 RepID=UPI001BDF60D0|nr:PSD1 and planctomycete cytochrome C domain-containing protein [Flavihumibacter rivuli]ULQ56977.1 PSD1 and planctomycete cytochrome C domain-containing protein [Flavihumibacter rivuli]
MKGRIILLIAVAISGMSVWVGCASNSSGNEAAIPETISYNYDIRPILSDKCFACHGPDQKKQEAGLRLDHPEFAYAPLRETKGAFAIVPGKPEQSELIKRITSTDPGYVMPTPESHLGALTEREVELFTEWIRQGAKYEPHWAFTRPEKAPLPKVADKEWPRNAIDHFIYEKMAEQGLSPNEAAGKEYLVKRVTLDLTGLLPTPAQVDAFLADNRPDAYERYVDQLLASPQYGEKMAVHWLDVSRYADSYGYQDDNIRTQWPYRDWVIHAFNKNMPYDQFITWQLAGDMLPDADKEKILATAFLRNHKYTEEGGVIDEEYRVEYLVDKVKTYTKGVLALTAECAQCHDHKYDPISQKDYFQLFAFFNNTKEIGYEGDVNISKPAKNPILTLTDEEVKNVLGFINKKDTGSLMVSVMGERDTLRPTYILNRGVYDQRGEVVQPSALRAVLPFDTLKLPRNRLGLAQWTVNRNNPITARVFVNQLWQEFFGRGIVKTTGDFGMQGNLPSHPKLLDWLAVDFMEHDWDIKRLVRLIVSSATYQQSARVSEKQLQRDPENIYLSRAPRTKVKAEFVRDIVLGSSGLLNKEIGGPSVKPYQPKGLWEAGTSGRGVLATYKQDHGNELYRRGMYTFIKLTLPPPSMIIFDASNRDQCEVKRTSTNTPLQALVMMNDPTVLEASRVLAQQLVVQSTDDAANITTAFRAILCRKPSTKEMDILGKYFKEELALYSSGKLAPEKLLGIGEWPQVKGADANRSVALMKVITTIYNMEEAITKS